MTPTRGRVRATWLLAATLGAGLAPTASQACGACAEDKIAATYDHGVVLLAAARGMAMVFCEVSGPLAAPRLKEAALRVRGVDPQSVRASTQPAALSFAVDTRQRSPQSAVEAAQRELPKGTQLTIVRVLTAKSPL